MPFELERYSADIYGQSVHSGPFDNEIEALESYLSEYKRQRATNPSNYFPPATLPRKTAANYIRENFPKGGSVVLMSFLEREGSVEACDALVRIDQSIPHLLPYRFLAAFLLKNDVVERQALLEMKQQGMLSEFLVAFGQNMIHSARDFDAIFTNGLQDLIAVRAAQLIQGIGAEIPVYNIFAEKCKGFGGATADNALAEARLRMWVSPVMSLDFLTKHENNLWTAGIGYAYGSNPLTDPQLPVAELIHVASRFEMPAVDPVSMNPSLKGLAKAYKPFLQSVDSYVIVSGSDKDRKKVREIAAYLEPYLR